jgi:molybdate transport repressor ModE-like protein
MPSNAAAGLLADQHVRSCIDRVTVKSKIWLEIDGQFAIGECGFELLRAIDVSGSLAGGAKALGWSYRHAWGYMHRAEIALGGKLLIQRGGKGARRGAVLSTLALELLDLNRRIHPATMNSMA